MDNSRIIKIKYQEIDINLYSEFLDNSDVVTPFHSVDWLKLIKDSRQDLELSFLVVVENNTWLAVMPYFSRKYMPFTTISMPYGGYGGFIYNKFNFEKIKAIIKNNNYFIHQITCIHSFDNLYDDFLLNKKLNTWVVDCRCTFDELFSSFNTKTRNQVRKSFKSNIIYKLIETKEELKECVKLYKNLVKKHNIQKPYSDKVFELLMRGSNESIEFWIAKYEDEVIAYSVFLKSKKEVFYWLSAFNNDFSKANPSLGILNKVFKTACEKKQIVNLGAVPLGNDGLKHFKQGVAGVKTEYKFYYNHYYSIANWLRSNVMGKR